MLGHRVADGVERDDRLDLAPRDRSAGPRRPRGRTSSRMRLRSGRTSNRIGWNGRSFAPASIERLRRASPSITGPLRSEEGVHRGEVREHRLVVGSRGSGRSAPMAPAGRDELATGLDSPVDSTAPRRGACSISSRREPHLGEADLRASGSVGPRRRCVEVDEPRPSPGVEVIGRERDPLGKERGDQVVELRQARAPRQVRGDREGGPPAQRVLDEPGEVAPRTDVDEEPDAVGVHRLDRPAERDGPRPLLDRQAADLVDVVGHRGPR